VLNRKGYTTSVYATNKLEQVKGLEPSTFSLGSCEADSVTHCKKKDYKGREIDMAEYSALLRRIKSDLLEVIETWDHLPDVLKSGFLAMIESSRTE